MGRMILSDSHDVIQLFTATKSESYAALLYIKGEEHEALNIEGNSRAESQAFVELAAITTAIECWKVSAQTGVSNLSRSFHWFHMYVENLELYQLLTGQREGPTDFSGRALRTLAKFQEAVQYIQEHTRVRLIDSCGLIECILHRAVENAYDRTKGPEFEAVMLNSVAPPGVLLPYYAHQATPGKPLSKKVTLPSINIAEMPGDPGQDGSR